MTGPDSYTLPALRQGAGVLLVKVRAQPGASREGVVGIHADALKIAVNAQPEKGRANSAVLRVAARALGVRPSRVRIHSGAASRDKWIEVDGLTPEEARLALRRCLGGGESTAE